jgi:putative tricarboxylic transport membrane protein
MTTQRGLRIGETVLGLAILALGFFIAIETWRMPVAITTAGFGPKFFPGLVATGLITTSGFLLREAIVGTLASRTGLELDWRPVGVVLSALLIQAVLLSTIGWIIASALLFGMVAWAFGGRKLHLIAAIGLLLGALTYLVFDYGLDLNLPTGSLIELFFDKAGEVGRS